MTRTRRHRVRVPSTRWATGAAVASVVLLTFAACSDSGGTEEASETQAWADDVCVAVTQWQGELATARAAVTDFANLSPAALEDAVDDVATATEDLVRDLDRLGAPETEAGGRAREELTTLSDTLADERQALADAASAPATGLDERRDQVTSMTAALRAMVSQTQRTVQELGELDGAEELSQAFDDATQCQDVR
jgi:hypothetical protein